MKRKEKGLEFEVDKLTNSIQNVVTGDVFQTDISHVSDNDIKLINKKNGWEFNWRIEFNQPARDVYKLTITNNTTVVQGLICLEIKSDHVYMHLLESAPFNKGHNKMYAGVPGNLVAFACKLSFQRGHDGNVAFVSKTNLISHYSQTLGAVHVGGRIMVINRFSALILVNKYFKNREA